MFCTCSGESLGLKKRFTKKSTASIVLLKRSKSSLADVPRTDLYIFCGESFKEKKYLGTQRKFCWWILTLLKFTCPKERKWAKGDILKKLPTFFRNTEKTSNFSSQNWTSCVQRNFRSRKSLNEIAHIVFCRLRSKYFCCLSRTFPENCLSKKQLLKTFTNQQTISLDIKKHQFTKLPYMCPEEVFDKMFKCENVISLQLSLTVSYQLCTVLPKLDCQMFGGTIWETFILRETFDWCNLFGKLWKASFFSFSGQNLGLIFSWNARWQKTSLDYKKLLDALWLYIIFDWSIIRMNSQNWILCVLSKVWLKILVWERCRGKIFWPRAKNV